MSNAQRKFLHIPSIALFTVMFSFWPIFADLITTSSIAGDKPPINITQDEPTISMHYEGEDLINIINDLAAQRKVNIILPQGASSIKTKVSLSVDKDLTISQAWDFLTLMLRAADYRIIEKAEHYSIVKMTKDSAKEAPVHLYINTPIDCIPDNDEHIRYLYSLINLRFPTEGENELQRVLTNIMPDNTSINKIDTHNNIILLAAPARLVKHTVSILKELDIPGFQEKMDIVYLKYAAPGEVATIFNEGILKQQSDDLMSYQPPSKKKSEGSFFARGVRIVPDERKKAVIILGRNKAVDQVKDFITRYLDIELDPGTSVVHTYTLQYLNAEDLEPVLRQIIDASRRIGLEQSKLATTSIAPDNLFDGVIIVADRPVSTADKKTHIGSNTLIVVARDHDWRKIKKLIRQLDQQLPQVFVEVLIADLSIDDTRRLGSMIRNPARFPMPAHINFQAAHVGDSITGDNVIDPTKSQTIGIIDKPEHKVADLLGLSSKTVDSKATPVAINLPIEPGSIAISVNDADGTTWNILHLLKLFKHSKILSHSHTIATHNKEAIIKGGEMRMLDGQIVQDNSSNNFRKQEKAEAYTTVKITPRINFASSDKPETGINLKVEISIDEFIDLKGNRITRKIITNVNVADNAVLALGGLTKTKSTIHGSGTPLLEKIPILGWFFKKRSEDNNLSSITVFMRLTKIEPRNREILRQKTSDYIAISDMCLEDGLLFDSWRDPITHWFFREQRLDCAHAEDLIARTIYKTYQNPLIQSLKTNLPSTKSLVAQKTTSGSHRNLKELMTQDKKSPLRPKS